VNDSELRELAKFISGLEINKTWTEKKAFELLKKYPDLIPKWIEVRRDMEEAEAKMKEVVEFT
jgi:hypothetical protein